MTISAHRAWAGPTERRETTLRRLLLGATLLTLIQAGLGMVVNLYVTVPTHHPGAHSSNYFVGSLRSVAWGIAHGTASLVVHTTLGLVVVVVAVATTAYAVRSTRRAIAGWSVLAGLFVIGAGFNGASFLDFGHNVSSLVMALLALAAIGCYATALTLLGAPDV